MKLTLTARRFTLDAMYSITDLKKGTLIELDGSPYRVVSYDHSSMGRGGAVVRTKLKNVRDGSVVSKTFKGSDKIASVDLRPVAAQYLYADQDLVHFMRSDTYEQLGLSRDLLEEQLAFLTEGREVTLLYVNDEPLSIDLPVKAELAIVEADPGIKGDSASNVMKKARTETGLSLQVPLFIEVGDRIRVDTRSGEYIERA